MRLVSIAVVAANRVIGDGTDQPFKFAEDWERFKALTMGHPLIVGRRTHQSIGLLPGRFSIVITHDPASVDFPPDAQGNLRGRAVPGIKEAIELAGELDQEVAHVVGGGQVYATTMDLVDELDITQVHADAEGSVLFPLIDPRIWREISREQPRKEFSFVRYRRR